jgi:hypothetical protein
MHGVQKTELHNHTEQKTADRENTAKKILQIRQKAHSAQGGQIVLYAVLRILVSDDLISNWRQVAKNK